MGIGNANYFISRQETPPPEGCILVELEGASVPLLLRGLSLYLSSAVWLSPADYSGGYQLVLAQMEGILSDCAAGIVNNLIALRGISPDAERDPATGVPLVSPQGSTLVGIWTALNHADRSVADYARGIEENTLTTATNVETGLLSNDGVLLQLLLAAI